jgi:thiol:disulfide interchange protein
MNAFFRWLYARHSNFVITAFALFAFPMYALVLYVVQPSELSALLLFAGSTALGSLLFSLGMWLFFAKHAIEQRRPNDVQSGRAH